MAEKGQGLEEVDETLKPLKFKCLSYSFFIHLASCRPSHRLHKFPHKLLNEWCFQNSLWLHLFSFIFPKEISKQKPY